MSFYVSEDELNAGNGVKFGLNSGLTLAALKGEEGHFGPQLNVQITKNGSLVSQVWLNEPRPVTEAYVSKKQGGGNGEKTTDPKHPDFIAQVQKVQRDFQAAVTHVLGTVLTDEGRRALLSEGEPNFQQILDRINKLDVQKEIAAGNVLVDVFMEYDYNKERYSGLKLPSRVNQGSFIIRHEEGDFEPKYTPDGSLIYVDPATGKNHKFSRSAKYLASEQAKPVSVRENTEAQGQDWSADTTVAEGASWG